MVGLSVPVAFALDHPIGFELPAAKIGTLTELRLPALRAGRASSRAAHLAVSSTSAPTATTCTRRYAGTHYIAYSRDAMSMVRAGAGKLLHDVDPAAVAPFLALPPSLSPRVIELAKKITAGRTNAPAKLLAILDWLRSTHDYTTNLQRNPAIADPLEDFLFEQKAGHCEYFASATAVLLRAAGVPSRYVNGFLGGEWNEIGHYVAVRENRAHSWAEAYMGELGWMRVDATPPNRGLFRMGRLRQIFDSIDFFWGRWVVGYDLGRQIELARSLGHRLGGASWTMAIPIPRRFPGRRWSRRWPGLAAPWSLVRRLVFRREVGSWVWTAGPPPARAWRRHAGGAPATEKALRAAGAARARSAARRRHRASSQRASPPVASAVARCSIASPDLYTGARFGRRSVDDGPLRELAARLPEIGRAPPPGRVPAAAAFGGLIVPRLLDHARAHGTRRWCRIVVRHQAAEEKWHSAAGAVASRSHSSPHTPSQRVSSEAPALQSPHDRLIKRFTPVRLALGIALLASGLTRMASAQTGLGGSIGTTTTALTADDLLIVVQSHSRVSALPRLRPATVLQRRTELLQLQRLPVSVFFTFTQSGFAKKPTLPQGTIEFWVGLNCNNVTVRNCQRLGDTLALSTFAANGGIVVTTTADQLSQNFGQPSVTGTTTVGDGSVVIGSDSANHRLPGVAACSTGVRHSSQTILGPSHLRRRLALRPSARLLTVQHRPGAATAT